MEAFKKKKFAVSTQTIKGGDGFSVEGLKHQRLTFYQ